MLFIVTIVLALVLALAAVRLRVTAYRLGAVVGAIVFVVIAIGQMVTVIDAGHVGVVDLFGNVSSTTLKPGVTLVNPLAVVKQFSTKTAEVFEQADVPSSEGLSVQLELSALYHLDPDKADEIYRTVGPDFENILLVPQFRSVVRGVTAEYEAKALYTSQRELLAQKIESTLKKLVAPRGIIIEATPLRKVTLPTKVKDAIEEKLRAEQESERMQFVLTKEKQEADRKRVEAQGIADFQRIVSEGINENLLKWKGIEATEKLAGSDNSKVVVIGSGNSGLPLILGGQ